MVGLPNGLDHHHWSVEPALNSPDIKFNPQNNLFLMFVISPEFKANTKLFYSVSKDGSTWSQAYDSNQAIPVCASNVGISVNNQGHLGDNNILAMGAQTDQNVNPTTCANPGVHANWSIYGDQIKLDFNMLSKITN